MNSKRNNYIYNPSNIKSKHNFSLLSIIVLTALSLVMLLSATILVSNISEQNSASAQENPKFYDWYYRYSGADHCFYDTNNNRIYQEIPGLYADLNEANHIYFDNFSLDISNENYPNVLKIDASDDFTITLRGTNNIIQTNNQNSDLETITFSTDHNLSINGDGALTINASSSKGQLSGSVTAISSENGSLVVGDSTTSPNINLNLDNGASLLGLCFGAGKNNKPTTINSGNLTISTGINYIGEVHAISNIDTGYEQNGGNVTINLSSNHESLDSYALDLESENTTFHQKAGNLTINLGTYTKAKLIKASHGFIQDGGEININVAAQTKTETANLNAIYVEGADFIHNNGDINVKFADNSTQKAITATIMCDECNFYQKSGNINIEFGKNYYHGDVYGIYLESGEKVDAKFFQEGGNISITAEGSTNTSGIMGIYAAGLTQTGGSIITNFKEMTSGESEDLVSIAGIMIMGTLQTSGENSLIDVQIGNVKSKETAFISGIMIFENFDISKGSTAIIKTGNIEANDIETSSNYGLDCFCANDNKTQYLVDKNSLLIVSIGGTTQATTNPYKCLPVSIKSNVDDIFQKAEGSTWRGSEKQVDDVTKIEEKCCSNTILLEGTTNSYLTYFKMEDKSTNEEALVKTLVAGRDIYTPEPVPPTPDPPTPDPGDNPGQNINTATGDFSPVIALAILALCSALYAGFALSKRRAK